MSRTFKRIISIMLAVIAVFGLALTPDTAALLSVSAATAYDVWVNGEQFTSDKLTITCGTGTAVFSPDDSTLTLNDAVITKADADGGAICAVSGSSLTILLNGSTVINAPGDDAISALVGSISIEDGPDPGTGALTVTADSYGIYAGSNINLRSGRLDIRATGEYGCALKAVGNVNITGSTAVLAAGSNGKQIESTKLVISGGSLMADAALLSPSPVNSGNTVLSLTEHTINSVSSVSGVQSLKVTYGGSDYAYGIDGVHTDRYGKLYLWLPDGAFVSESSITTTSTSTTSTSTTTTTSTTKPVSDVPAYIRLTGNNVNMRVSAPSGEVIRMLPIFACYPCTEVTTIGGDKWYKITSGDDQGWVSGKYAAEEEDGKFILVTATNVNVRRSAPSGTVIDTVTENNYYKYTETTTASGNTWYKITLGSVSGWICGLYCKDVSSTSSTTAGSGSSGGTTTTTTAVSSSGYVKMSGSKINVRGTAGSSDADDIVTKTGNKNAYYPFTATASISGVTWYKITVGSTEGWVTGKYATPASGDAKYVRITGENINVRTTAGTGTPIATVSIDEYYPYTDTLQQGGTTCYKITVGSKQGWIVGTYAEVAGSTPGATTNASDTTASTTTTTTAPAAKASKDYVQATAGKVNVRNAANGTTIVTTIKDNMKNGWFKYSDVNTISGIKWYKITIGNQTGWVSGDYVTAATKEAKYVRVTNTLVNVRGTAGTTDSSDVVAQVPMYCNYPFTETTTIDGVIWYKISIGTTTGWISGKYVTLSDPDNSTTTTTTTSTTTTTTTTTTAPAVIDGTVRLYGTSRLDTAIAISKQGWSGGANCAILAYSHGYADALAGVSLAGALDAPILLTGGVTLEDSVKAELQRLNVNKVYILGGTGVISASLESSLSSTYTVKRLSGGNRYETAVAIAKELREVTGKDFTTLYFASSDGFADALSISPVAAIQGNPVLYAPKTGALDSSTAEYIGDLGCSSAVIVGGTLAVSDSARNSIITCGVANVSRINGTSRYDTSLKINTTYNTYFTEKGISISTGKNFPDALAGGALSAKYGLPVVLIDSGVSVSGLKSYISGRGYQTAYIYGGAQAVSNDTVNSIIK